MQQLRGWGLHVQPRRWHLPQRYLAGTDVQRATAFEAAYLDESLRGIFITRGGYGSTRLLPLLNGERLRRASPKVVLGFSDITALLAYLNDSLGVMALHGPCLAAPWLWDSAACWRHWEVLQRVLFEDDHRHLAAADRPALRWLAGPSLEAASRARARGGSCDENLCGVIKGGSLSLLCSLLGTPWALDTRGSLLFLEEVNEPLYRVDRLWTQLRLSGALERATAVLLGDFVHRHAGQQRALRASLAEVFGDSPVPVLQGLPCGHGALNLPLPLGRRGYLLAEGEGYRLHLADSSDR